MSIISDEDERDTAPFLVRLFHRSGSFHRPEEFASSSLPPHISVYTWSSCTLHELALEIADAKPNALPNPTVGTRLSFQLVCPDLRGTSATSTTQPRFAVKDLGSIVIGEGGPGTESDDGTLNGLRRENPASSKTLSDWRFVVGDYISCAILPPLSDGSVAPASSVRRGSISAGRDGRNNFRGGLTGREDSSGRSTIRPGRGGRRDGNFPTGDWRRGEKLPDGPPGRPRGRGRW